MKTQHTQASGRQQARPRCLSTPTKVPLISLFGLLLIVQGYRLAAAELQRPADQATSPLVNYEDLELAGLLNQSARLSSPLMASRYPVLKWHNCTIRLHPQRNEVDSPAARESGARQDDDDLISALKRAASSHETMPTITSSFNPNRREQLESCENFFHKHDEAHQRHSLHEFTLMALMAKTHSTVYNDIYTQRYDNFNEIKLASGPMVDQELCLKQLTELNERARRQEVEKFHSRDVNLFQLLDTMGHIPPGMLVGNGFFVGMYNECLRLKIKLHGDASGEPTSVPTRYCVATFKHTHWPRLDKHDVVNGKLGLCLPKTCDSMNYKNKYELVMRLASYNMRKVDEDQFRLNFLYCLPDEDSQLRSVFRSAPKNWLTLLGLAGWVAVLVYATHKYDQLTKNKSYAQRKNFSLTEGFAEHQAKEGPREDGRELEDQRLKIYRLLSIRNNLRNLFDVSKESAIKSAYSQEVGSAQTAGAPAKSYVDLSCIEGIKVISMSYVIMGHVLMCLTALLNNGREMADTSSMAFYMANLVPAFAVNSFFTITGVLTCYLLFKQGRSNGTLMMRPSSWLAFIVYRYLRIMPLYALVVLYTKTLAKFTGSGPLWDYGTSSLGQRRACEQEPWSNTFLFKANFVPPLEHCLPSGWYLANDFQFFLATPLLMTLLSWRPKWGERLLMGGALAGFCSGFLTILLSDTDDVRPITSFAPHAFKTYISHFSNTYTHPWFRCPAYLVGLLVGYKLFKYEQSLIEYNKRALERADGGGGEPAPEQLERPDWPDWLKRHAIHLSVGLILLCCATPVIGARLPFDKASAKFMFALVMNGYHIMFSTAIGLYLMMATTGQGNKLLDGLLSAAFWKPLARLSLCAVLINVEVINYIVQSNTRTQYLTNQYHLALNILCILATYAVSVVVCVLFEAPIRGALNSLLGSLVSRLLRKRKVE